MYDCKKLEQNLLFLGPKVKEKQKSVAESR